MPATKGGEVGCGKFLQMLTREEGASLQMLRGVDHPTNLIKRITNLLKFIKQFVPVMETRGVGQLMKASDKTGKGGQPNTENH